MRNIVFALILSLSFSIAFAQYDIAADTTTTLSAPGAVVVVPMLDISRGNDTVVGPAGEEIGENDTNGSTSGNVETSYKVGEGEKGAGDPDQPIITGNVYNENDSSGGTNEITMDDTGGAEGSKPKELVVVGSKLISKVVETKGSGDVIIKGSKIKENAPEFDDDHDKWIEILALTVETEEDLQAFAVAMVYNDVNIEEVTFGFQKISIDYSQPAKLFGFIDIDYTYHAEVDELGRIKVQFPWWMFLTQNTANDITLELEEQLGEDSELANIDLQNSLQKQQQTLQTMSNVMKSHHDTAMLIIRKAG